MTKGQNRSDHPTWRGFLDLGEVYHMQQPEPNKQVAKPTLPIQQYSDAPMCAWCLEEAGMDLGEGSHGICARHATWVLQQQRERNKHRQRPQ